MVVLFLLLVLGIATSFLTALIVGGVLLVLTLVIAFKVSERRDKERAAAREARYEGLKARFGADIARNIMDGKYWQGATFEMMRESLGHPEDVKEKVFKAKTSTTHYYRQLSPQRYGLKIHFENGEVVGWDE